MNRRIILWQISLFSKRNLIHFNKCESIGKNIYSFSSTKKDKENNEKNKKQQIQMKHQNHHLSNNDNIHCPKSDDFNKLPENIKKLYKIKKEAINL
jgi:hypothetical protein